MQSTKILKSGQHP